MNRIHTTQSVDELIKIVDILTDSATSFYEEINNTRRSAPELKCPSTVKDLASMDGNLPPKLLNFLTILMTGRPVCSKRMERLVHLIDQDISRATTSGAWKQPKHVILCITLRHLFRRGKLINILNRFGHCENYAFSLELETAIAQTVIEMSSVLSLQIIRNPDIPAVFHSEFDNFDQLINTDWNGFCSHSPWNNATGTQWGYCRTYC